MSIIKDFKCLIESNIYKYSVNLNNNTNCVKFKDVLNEIQKIDSKSNISMKRHAFEIFDTDFNDYVFIRSKEQIIDNISRIRISIKLKDLNFNTSNDEIYEDINDEKEDKSLEIIEKQVKTEPKDLSNYDLKDCKCGIKCESKNTKTSIINSNEESKTVEKKIEEDLDEDYCEIIPIVEQELNIEEITIDSDDDCIEEIVEPLTDGMKTIGNDSQINKDFRTDPNYDERKNSYRIPHLKDRKQSETETKRYFRQFGHKVSDISKDDNNRDFRRVPNFEECIKDIDELLAENDTKNIVNNLRIEETDEEIDEKSVRIPKIINFNNLRIKNDFRRDPNYIGLQSLQNLDQYFERRVLNGLKQYICKYNNNYCNFVTNGSKASQQMARHINLRHLKIRKFKCNQINCFKVFESPTTLREHLKNHLCGFGIFHKKRLKNSICGNDSINRYRNRVIINGIKSFECGFNGCDFMTKSHSCIKRHIHNQHLCPNRFTLNNIPIITNQLSEQNLQNIVTHIQNVEQKPQNNVQTSQRKIKLDFSQIDYEKCSKELNTLKKIGSYFKREVVDNQNTYKCKFETCGHSAKSLEFIEIHLKIKHFIS